MTETNEPFGLPDAEPFLEQLTIAMLEVLLTFTDLGPLAQIPIEILVVYAFVAAAANGFIIGFVVALDLTAHRKMVVTQGFDSTPTAPANTPHYDESKE